LAHNRFSFVYGGVALNPRVQATHLPNQSQSRPVQVGGGRGGNGGGHGGGSSGGSGGGGGGLRVSGSGPNRKVAGFQDHHIISHTNRHTKGHELITLAGANLQSRQNRIFLPTHASHHPSRSIHCGRHWSRNYSWQVADKMDKTVEKGKAKNWSQQQYKQAYDDMLKGIRIGLRQGTVALNSNARPGARPVFS